MSKVMFKGEAFNPNINATKFQHQAFTEYIANSVYAILNPTTNHGLFGKIQEYPNIQEMEDVLPMANYIFNLAEDKTAITRGTISMYPSDAIRLGYDRQEKWIDLLRDKIPDYAEKLNIPYRNLEYVGSVHFEKEHPHIQFLMWDRSQGVKDYFIQSYKSDWFRKKLINEVFKEDLIPIYQEKDRSKQNILEENYILKQLKELKYDDRFISKVATLEVGFARNQVMQRRLRNDEVVPILNKILELGQELPKEGSLNYQLLSAKVKEKVDTISREIIHSSKECEVEYSKFIKAKESLEEFKYKDPVQLENAKEIVRTKADAELLKDVGNKIMDFQRTIIKNEGERESQTNINSTRNLVQDVFSILSNFASSKEAQNYKQIVTRQIAKEQEKQKKTESTWEWGNE